VPAGRGIKTAAKIGIFLDMEPKKLKKSYKLGFQQNIKVPHAIDFVSMSYRTEQPIDALPPTSVGMTWVAQRVYLCLQITH